MQKQRRSAACWRCSAKRLRYYVCEQDGNPLHHLFFAERTSRTCQFNLCAFAPREHLIEQVRCFFVCSVFSEPDEHGVLRALKRQKKKKTGLNQTAKQLFGCKQTLGISVLILQAGEKMYQVEVQVKTLTVPEWLEKYCRPEKFVPLCRECPQYGKNWSCPPGMTTAEALAGDYRYVQVIGLKVKYDEQVLREAEHSPQRTEELRQETYEAAKKKLLQALLALEREFPGSKTIMAGGCTLCRTCARVQGEPCRYPEKMRYSYSGLGFDLGRISEELLGMPLLWQKRGLPAYTVAIASFLHN